MNCLCRWWSWEMALLGSLLWSRSIARESSQQSTRRPSAWTSWRRGYGEDLWSIPNFKASPSFSVNGEDVRLMLWDTAGQEEFDCITRAYYRCLELLEVQEKLDRNVSGAPRPASLPSPAWTGSRSSRWGGGRGRWRRSAATSPLCSSWPRWTCSTRLPSTALRLRRCPETLVCPSSRPRWRRTWTSPR